MLCIVYPVGSEGHVVKCFRVYVAYTIMKECCQVGNRNDIELWSSGRM